MRGIVGSLQIGEFISVPALYLGQQQQQLGINGMRFFMVSEDDVMSHVYNSCNGMPINPS